jgi:hypothetical protein
MCFLPLSVFKQTKKKRVYTLQDAGKTYDSVDSLINALDPELYQVSGLISAEIYKPHSVFISYI